MTARAMLGLVLVAMLAGNAAADVITVSGSQYATDMEALVGGAKVKMNLTGAAVRSKFFVNVYTIGSYVQAGQTIRTPEELAARDCPKLLLLIMQRDLTGAEMADAIERAIRANYPAPQFADEVKALRDRFTQNDIKRGDRVWLLHLPGTGLRVTLEGKTEALIANPRFSRSVWDIYLGKNNLGEDIKRGLVSR